MTTEERLTKALDTLAAEPSVDTTAPAHVLRRARRRIVKTAALVVMALTACVAAAIPLLRGFDVQHPGTAAGQITLAGCITSVSAGAAGSGSQLSMTCLPDGPTRVVSSSFRDYADPTWSPDGTQIAFSAADELGYNIYVMNADGSGLHSLTSDTAVNLHPTWNPDATAIAYSSDRQDPHAGDVGAITQSDIWVATVNGQSSTDLTPNSEADNVDPSWAPDGTAIAFASNRTDNYDIYTMASDGGAVTSLTSRPGADTFPAWSPDGSMIAFSGNQDDTYDVFVMNSDGTATRDITNDRYNDTAPAWAPDQTALAFATDANQEAAAPGTTNYDIVAIGLDGTGRSALIAGPRFETAPSWNLGTLARAVAHASAGPTPTCICR